ncbi:hypothetical protein AB0G04_37690 [Actinoplanes sp. NPDC023801]|uniref:hypothetical protein n=1 Tax=Actinoplanes sp. NPDC023801 TaxID=3154595 RepID=UPI0033C01242
MTSRSTSPATEEEPEPPPPDGPWVVLFGRGAGAVVRRFAVDAGRDCERLGVALADGEADADAVADGDAVAEADGAPLTGVPVVSASVAGSAGAVVSGVVEARRISRSPEVAPATITAEPVPINPKAPMAVRM